MASSCNLKKIFSSRDRGRNFKSHLDCGPGQSRRTRVKDQITILYDAFGSDPSMTKDWGFSALVEVAGKRICLTPAMMPTFLQPM